MTSSAFELFDSCERARNLPSRWMLLLLKVSCVSVWRNVWLLFSVVSRLLSLMAGASMVMSVSSRIQTNPKMTKCHAYASCSCCSSSSSLPLRSFPLHPKYKDVPIPSNPSQRHSPLRKDRVRERCCISKPRLSINLVVSKSFRWKYPRSHSRT